MRGEAGTFRELEGELLRILDRGFDRPLSDEEFNHLALRVFRFQCRYVLPYGAFVTRRGVDPGRIVRWEEIPPLPARAFKSATLMAGDPGGAEAVFRTSGTSEGEEARGRHHVRSLALYRASLLPNFRIHLFPEGGGLPVLALLSDPGEAPGSSLSYMLGEVKDRLCGGRGEFFVDPVSGLRVGDLLRALRESENRGNPVLLAGTAFAFVHCLDAMDSEDWRVSLPGNSRIMETGGFKGRSRTVAREVLYQGLEDAFGVPRDLIVNEYGMTELLSQFYEPVLAESRGRPGDRGGRTELGGLGLTSKTGLEGLSGRYHRGPPWVRTRALHPLTLEPVPEGEVGILTHVDLANAGSVSAVLTEDLGRMVQGGFQLRGRSSGAEPRGCSLAMEEFLAVSEGESNAF